MVARPRVNKAVNFMVTNDGVKRNDYKTEGIEGTSRVLYVYSGGRRGKRVPGRSDEKSIKRMNHTQGNTGSGPGFSRVMPDAASAPRGGTQPVITVLSDRRKYTREGLSYGWHSAMTCLAF